MNLQALEAKLGLKFHNPKLIANSFVHRSYLNESKVYKQSNERLEYLGDAVLELATSEFLYTNYPDFQEGMLTSLRASLVKTTTLAQVAKEIGLDSFLLMSRGEAETGRNNQSTLANVMEAFLGAIYLDQGIPAVDRLLLTYLFPKIKVILAKSAYKDNKSTLQEIAQRDLKTTPTYELQTAIGPDHDKIFTMQVVIGNKKYGVGKGKSKQAAQEEAAKITLEMIRKS